ncbi:dihydroxyacetone kinase phosphoryl donor subunit DhaM [Agromyces seonyuensis]|uniref:Phosphocarrier protein HPr n=1 Tax=Agromyces seonyuensis TaxID=2662446 RepID=A0A6I4NU43_9MICO|nr:HPr family phosphocarrier protein [Agromyces seonyuensis]
MPGKVGLVFVSHSEKLADGLVELAGQMAVATALESAGGTDDGRIGTSFEKVGAAIARADSGAGVVVVCDLGSAILTSETALEFLGDEERARTRIASAPFVEGGVAAAVAAESGDPLDVVLRAAEDAAASLGPDSGAAPPESAVAAPAAPAEGGYRRTVTLINETGLHARPAAELVKLAGTFPAAVTVNGTNAKSLLGIMSMGLVKGAVVEVASVDAEGRDAVDALADLIETGFGEV